MTKNQNETFITEEESKTCLLDGKVFDSSRKMMWHVRKQYNLDFEQYIINSYYNGVRPVCLKSGKPLVFKASKLGPFFHNYARNEFPRKPHSEESKKKIKDGCEKNSLKKFGVKNVFEAEWCKNKIKKTIQEKYGVNNVMKMNDIKSKVLASFLETIAARPKKIKDTYKNDINRTSSLEKDLKRKLEELNIEFKSPFVYNKKRYDFYIPSINTVVEIDGDVFHKDTLENLSIININGSVNDYNKNDMIQQLSGSFHRIRYNPDDFSFNSMPEFIIELNKSQYAPDYSLTYKQKISSKEYFERYIERYGKEKLKSYVYLFLKFIRTFQPSFPFPDLEENLKDIINKLSLIKLNEIYNNNTREFSNNISTVGHNYLKHHFHSYWKSNFNGNLSPMEAWLDNKIMKEVIEYRIGCNDSNEIFDFSLHQLVRGLSARRITISFFKPLLAAAIYKHYIGDNQCPVVLDPCCGFGGRLLGFKSIYPNGTYIGCEPNIETYNELIKLKDDAQWDNVSIYNCAFEDFNDVYNNYDLIFTSIPYYDKEIYSNNIKYESFNIWKSLFINALEKYSGKNCYINVPEELYNKLEWNNKNIDSYIVSNRTHFDDREGKKKEIIVKI